MTMSMREDDDDDDDDDTNDGIGDESELPRSRYDGSRACPT